MPPSSFGFVPVVDRSASRYRSWLVVILVSAAALRFAFWIATRWTIEDALIIARMARNLAQYGILSFNPGTAVSSATSWPFALLVGGLSRLGIDPLDAAKMLGLLASTATCALVFDLLCGVESVPAAAAASVFYVFLPPVVAYSVSGMETAVYTFFSCLGLERALRGRLTHSLFAASIAFLLRPDGVILLAILACYAILKGQTTRAVMRWVWPSLLLLAIGFSAHRVYYGTWLPQTVLAKSLGYPIDPLKNSIKYLRRLLLAQPTGLFVYAFALWGLWHSVSRYRPLFLLAIWYALYYAFFAIRAPLFDWYLQPPLVVLCFFAGLGSLEGLRAVTTRVRSRKASTLLFATGTAAISVVLLLALAWYARGRVEAQRYEDGVRGAVSRWIAVNAAADALVFTESLGYIGYQNSNPFVDWPGLVSRDVARIITAAGAEKSRRRGYDAIIGAFRPDFLAVRREEWMLLAPRLKKEYQLCAEFPVPTPSGEPYVVAKRLRTFAPPDVTTTERPEVDR